MDQKDKKLDLSLLIVVGWLRGVEQVKLVNPSSPPSLVASYQKALLYTQKCTTYAREDLYLSISSPITAAVLKI